MKTTYEEFRVKSEELTPAVANRRTSGSFSTLSHSNSGFSLVEVMISIGIVAFAVVGILTAFPVGIESARDARDENTAAFIADDVFGRLRAQASYTSLKVLRSGSFYTPSYGKINRQWSYSPPAGNSSATDQLYYYTVDGMPANFASSGMGSWGAQPGLGTGYKGDEGYFGVRVFVSYDPFYYCPSATGTPQLTCDTSVGHDTAFNDDMMSLATLIVEISWPARQPYNSRVVGHVRSYYSSLANFH